MNFNQFELPIYDTTVEMPAKICSELISMINKTCSEYAEQRTFIFAQFIDKKIKCLDKSLHNDSFDPGAGSRIARSHASDFRSDSLMVDQAMNFAKNKTVRSKVIIDFHTHMSGCVGMDGNEYKEYWKLSSVDYENNLAFANLIKDEQVSYLSGIIAVETTTKTANLSLIYHDRTTGIDYRIANFKVEGKLLPQLGDVPYLCVNNKLCI